MPPEVSNPEPQTVRCLRCNRENARPVDGGKQGHRCSGCKSFLPGNAARLRHGLRRPKDRVALSPDLQQGIADFRDQLISDAGGVEDLTAVRSGLIRLLVGAETAFRVAGNELTRQGGSPHLGAA